MEDVIIVGGGLAGLTSAILLGGNNRKVTVLEKGKYPRHKVCGEYVSNEVNEFLVRNDIAPFPFKTPQIDTLKVTTFSGRSLELPLDLGGFGISRYQMDYHLAQVAQYKGISLQTNRKVNAISYDSKKDLFSVKTHKGNFLQAPVVIGSFGKLSTMDRHLKRDFLHESSPFIGVKYHITTNLPDNKIALHNFPGGYCGLSKVENNHYCFCYLARREHLKKTKDINQMEKEVLSQNPFLKEIFETSHFFWDKPLVINEISFAQKRLIENHVLTGGDAAGMITPLCGNGIAMALHSAKLVASNIEQFLSGKLNRPEMENQYQKAWFRNFGSRLRSGLKLQDYAFGQNHLSELAMEFFQIFPGLGKRLIPFTHGKHF